MNLDFLNTPLWTLGQHTTTLASALTAVAIFGGAILLASAFRRFVSRLQERSGPAANPSVYVANKVGRYIIVFVGLLAAASVLGVDFSSLSLFAGALGIGIGLGVQDIVKDFIAGLVLLFDRSIEVGDFIELEDGVAGEIKSVGARATMILTNDNVNLLVPNSMLLTGRLTNWTRNRATRRIHVPFRVALGADKSLVRAAALEAATSVSFTLPDTDLRRSQVWLVGYDESAMKFELVVWPALEAVKRPGGMMAAYYWAIDDALRRHAIEIPWPQAELRIRSLFQNEGEAGLRAWQGDRVGLMQDTGTAQPVTTVNDAAIEITEKEEERARKVEEAGTRETAEMMKRAGSAAHEDDGP